MLIPAPHLQQPRRWVPSASLEQGRSLGLPLPNDLHAASSIDLEQLRDACDEHMAQAGQEPTPLPVRD